MIIAKVENGKVSFEFKGFTPDFMTDLAILNASLIMAMDVKANGEIANYMDVVDVVAKSTKQAILLRSIHGNE